MDYIPIILFWILLGVSLFVPGPFIFYLLFACLPFGSFAVIPTDITQGLTLTPPPVIAVFIVILYAGGKNGVSNLLDVALKPSQGLLLFLFWLVTIWVTLFMPRLFAGAAAVIPMKLEEMTTGVPLQPTQQNLSQLLYLSISILTVLVCANAFRSQATRQHILSAICVGAAMTIFTGILDLASQYLPLDPLLSVFRTGTYAFLTDVEIANVKRVVGLMPEASSYGTLVVSLLGGIYFFRRAMTNSFLRLWIAPCLIALLAVFALLSTSSTAYAGLGILALVAAIEWVVRAVHAAPGTRFREGLQMEFWALVAALTLVYLFVLFKPSLFDPLLDLLDTLIFKKTSSDSFEERSMWTTVSLQALWDTWGLGVGLGATRASNGIVAVFSNSGIAGGILYYSFLLQVAFFRPRRGDETGAALLVAIRAYMIPVLFMGILSATSADFGVMNGCIYALALAAAGSRSASLRPLPLQSRPETSS